MSGNEDHLTKSRYAKQYWIVSFLLVGVVFFVSYSWLGKLASEYGTRYEDRQHVTNPEHISIAFVEALEFCEQTETNQRERCEQAIKGLERTISAHDLGAQRSMARSALGLLHLNFWQLLFGILTLFAIGWTLLETRRTADAAKDTVQVSKYAERAYMFATGVSVVHEGGHYYWIVAWDNQGNSPAEKCSCVGGWLRTSDDPPVLRQISAHENALSIGGKSGFGQRILVNEKYAVKCFLNGKDIFVWGSVFYTDIFGESRTANVCFHVFPNDSVSVSWPEADKTRDFSKNFSWRFSTAEWKSEQREVS